MFSTTWLRFGDESSKNFVQQNNDKTTFTSRMWNGASSVVQTKFHLRHNAHLDALHAHHLKTGNSTTTTSTAASATARDGSLVNNEMPHPLNYNDAEHDIWKSLSLSALQLPEGETSSSTLAVNNNDLQLPEEDTSFHLVVNENNINSEPVANWMNVSQARAYLTSSNRSIPIGNRAPFYVQIPISMLSHSMLDDDKDGRKDFQHTFNQTIKGQSVSFWMKLTPHQEVGHHDPSEDTSSQTTPFTNIVLWSDQRASCDNHDKHQQHVAEKVRTGDRYGEYTGTTFSIIKKKKKDNEYNYMWQLQYGMNHGQSCGVLTIPFFDNNNDHTNNGDNKQQSHETSSIEQAYKELLSYHWTHVGIVLEPQPSWSNNATTNSKKDHGQEDIALLQGSRKGDDTNKKVKPDQILRPWDFVLYLNGIEVSRRTDMISTNDLLSHSIHIKQYYETDLKEYNTKLQQYKTDLIMYEKERTKQQQHQSHNVHLMSSTRTTPKLHRRLTSFNFLARPSSALPPRPERPLPPRFPGNLISLFPTRTRNDCFAERSSSNDDHDGQLGLQDGDTSIENTKKYNQCTQSKTILGRPRYLAYPERQPSNDDEKKITNSYHHQASMALLAVWEGLALTSVQMKYAFQSADQMATTPLSSTTMKPSYFYPLDDVSQKIQTEEQHKDWELDTSLSLREVVHSTLQSNKTKIYYSPYYGKLYRSKIPSLEEEYNSIPKGGYRYTAYLNGTYATEIGDKHIRRMFEQEARRKRQHVLNAMKHAWKGYQDYAWGYDEVKPITKTGVNRWGGMGTTLVDSLDTLWLLGMKDEFYEARDWVRDHLHHEHVSNKVSVFETTIRSMGGLLAAHHVSEGDPAFLDRAEDLGYRLFRAIGSPDIIMNQESTDNDDQNGSNQKQQQQHQQHFYPPVHFSSDWAYIGGRKEECDEDDKTTKHVQCDDRPLEQSFPSKDEHSSVANIGTLQMEFRELTAHTKNTTYGRTVESIFQMFYNASVDASLKVKIADKEMHHGSIADDIKLLNDGLYPFMVSRHVVHNKASPSVSLLFNGKVTFGGMGDSFYEYMLKLWLQGGKTEPMYRHMYDKAMDGMHKYLIHTSEPNGLTYLSTLVDLHRNMYDSTMEHLACFTSGLLALGAYTSPEGLSSERSQRDLKTSKALAYTCYQMYARTATGISPEAIKFNNEKNVVRHGNVRGSGTTTKTHVDDFSIEGGMTYYILRPETVESFYILHTLTGDPIYQEWGWEIFLAIEHYCRNDVAYGSIRDVTKASTKRGGYDEMESFFLAETLKYLYLLFDDENEIDLLSKHVFNTEAHLLSVFEKPKQQPKTTTTTLLEFIGSRLGHQVVKPNLPPQSANDKDELVDIEVVSPGTYNEGHILVVDLHEDDPTASKVRVKVPKGGVKKGESFVAFVRANELWPDRHSTTSKRQATISTYSTHRATTGNHGVSTAMNHAHPPPLLTKSAISNTNMGEEEVATANRVLGLEDPSVVKIHSSSNHEHGSFIDFQVMEDETDPRPVFQVQVPDGGVKAGQSFLAQLPDTYVLENFVHERQQKDIVFNHPMSLNVAKMTVTALSSHEHHPEQQNYAPLPFNNSQIAHDIAAVTLPHHNHNTHHLMHHNNVKNEDNNNHARYDFMKHPKGHHHTTRKVRIDNHH